MDDLTKRIAEALEARIKQAIIPDSSVPSFGGAVGHLLAATPHDLAATAMTVVKPALKRKAIGRAYVDLQEFADRETARADAAEAEVERLRARQSELTKWVADLTDRAEQAEAERDALQAATDRVRRRAQVWIDIRPTYPTATREGHALADAGLQILAAFDPTPDDRDEVARRITALDPAGEAETP